jgi:hypothetical protein
MAQLPPDRHPPDVRRPSVLRTTGIQFDHAGRADNPRSPTGCLDVPSRQFVLHHESFDVASEAIQHRDSLV